jgi:hypothetical protein
MADRADLVALGQNTRQEQTDQQQNAPLHHFNPFGFGNRLAHLLLLPFGCALTKSRKNFQPELQLFYLLLEPAM